MTRFFLRFALALAGLYLLPIAVTGQNPDPWEALFRPRTHAPKPTTAAITEKDLKTRVYLFADDSMAGRMLDSPGNVKAAEYLAAEAQRLGLVPAGDSGGYFQRVPMVNRIFDPASRLVVQGQTLTPWKDYVPRDQGLGERAIDGVPVVYGGTWGVGATLLPPDSAAGKLVIFSLAPTGYSGNTPGTANRAVVSARYRDAAGVAIAGLDLVPPPLVDFYKAPFQQMIGDETVPLPSFLYLTKRVAETIMGSPLDRLTAGAAGRPVQSSLGFLSQPIEYPARNVVAMLRGSDPALRDEYVAIGAHNDHIGVGGRGVAHDSIYVLGHLFRPGGADDPTPRPTPEQVAQLNAAIAAIRARSGGASARPDSIYNGADDDASGSMGLLEIAEYFAGQRVKPKRSLIFIWHVGEEEGLYGSEYFTDHPTVPRDKIVAQLNIDMIGRGEAGDNTGNALGGSRLWGNPDYLQLIGSRRLSTELGDLAERVNQSSERPLAFDYAMDANGHPQNIYCRSDHWSYARYGIPIIFFSTGGHADYHQVTDESQYIDYPHLTRVTQYIADLASAVAGLDHRVVVDKAVPEKGAGCKQ